MAQKIKMLKPGRFKSMSGKVVNLTEAHLAATAAAYDPAIYAAPMVVGHPTVESPAYGKIAAADFSDGFLNGEPTKVDPAFARIVNGGYYDHVSLSLFEPDSPSNPVPGVYYPRHLGFLGAVAPAVPGLGTVSLAADEAGVVSFALGKGGMVALGGYEDRVLVRILRGLKNTLIGEWGKEKADATIDEWDLQLLTEEAVRPDPPMDISPEPAFAEHQKGGATMTPEELQQKETDLAAREKALLAGENSRKHTANLEFAESLVKEGKLLPANKAAAVAVLDFASGVTSGNTIEFGDGDAKKTEAPLATIKALFSAMPKVIEFAELGGGAEPESQKKAIPADLAKYV